MKSPVNQTFTGLFHILKPTYLISMSNKKVFSKHIHLNHEGILNAKKKNFIGRSWWKYLLAAVLFTVAKPDFFGSSLKTFLGLFIILISISVFTIFVSAKFMANKLGLNVRIDFNEDDFLIEDLNQEGKEQLIDWKSVHKLKEFKSVFVIDLDKISPHLISIKKEELNEDEMNYFRSKMVSA